VPKPATGKNPFLNLPTCLAAHLLCFPVVREIVQIDNSVGCNLPLLTKFPRKLTDSSHDDGWSGLGAVSSGSLAFGFPEC
jgi:hypothetical protein